MRRSIGGSGSTCARADTIRVHAALLGARHKCSALRFMMLPPAGMPILRHYSSAYKYYGGVPGAQLIVRMISTVYNYDYIQDLVLGVDGTIDVRVTTSGFIQSTTARGFYPQHFGFPLAQNVTGEEVLHNDWLYAHFVLLVDAFFRAPFCMLSVHLQLCDTINCRATHLPYISKALAGSLHLP